MDNMELVGPYTCRARGWAVVPAAMSCQSDEARNCGTDNSF